MNNHSSQKTPEQQDPPSAREVGKHGYHKPRTTMVRTKRAAIYQLKYYRRQAGNDFHIQNVMSGEISIPLSTSKTLMTTGIHDLI